MGYLVCNNCDGYYKLEPGESPNDFDNQCECGGKLIYTKTLPNPINKNKKEISSCGYSYTDKNSFNYKIVIVFGISLIIVGILGMMMSNILGFILGVFGILILYEGYQKGHSWIKGDMGEKIVSDYLKDLPKGYYVFNDLTIPNGKGNIDHLVIGPTGIFLIETKHFSGSFQISGDEWKKKTGFHYSNIKGTPGKQAKRNALDLSKLLNSQRLSKGKIWVTAMVCLLSDDFTIVKEPKFYSILHPADAHEFIVNCNDKIDRNTIINVFNFIQEYSTDIIYDKDDVYVLNSNPKLE